MEAFAFSPFEGGRRAIADGGMFVFEQGTIFH